MWAFFHLHNNMHKLLYAEIAAWVINGYELVFGDANEGERSFICKMVNVP